MTRTAAQLDDTFLPGDRCPEPVQELAIERLVRQLAADLLRVAPGDRVVGRARVVRVEQARQPPAPTGPVGRL